MKWKSGSTAVGYKIAGSTECSIAFGSKAAIYGRIRVFMFVQTGDKLMTFLTANRFVHAV